MPIYQNMPIMRIASLNITVETFLENTFLYYIIQSYAMSNIRIKVEIKGADVVCSYFTITSYAKNIVHILDGFDCI